MLVLRVHRLTRWHQTMEQFPNRNLPQMCCLLVVHTNDIVRQVCLLHTPPNRQSTEELEHIILVRLPMLWYLYQIILQRRLPNKIFWELVLVVCNPSYYSCKSCYCAYNNKESEFYQWIVWIIKHFLHAKAMLPTPDAM